MTRRSCRVSSVPLLAILVVALPGCSTPDDVYVRLNMNGAHTGDDYVIGRRVEVFSSPRYKESWVEVWVSNIGENDTRSPEMVADVSTDQITVHCGNSRGHVYWSGSGDAMAETLMCESYIPPSEFDRLSVELRSAHSWSGQTWINPDL